MTTFQVSGPAELTSFGYVVTDECLDTHPQDPYCGGKCDQPVRPRPCVPRNEDQAAAGGHHQPGCHDATFYTSILSRNDPSIYNSSDLGLLPWTNGARLSTSLYPYANTQGLWNIPASKPDAQDNALQVDRPWEHVPTQSTIFNTAPTGALEDDITSSPQSLNWGSDICFQPNTNYTVPKHEPSEEQLMARLLENNSSFILRYKDACAQEQQQEEEEEEQQQQQQQQPQKPSRPRARTRDKPSEPQAPRVRKRHLATALEREAAHIQSEQQRRHLVNQGFDELRLLVPELRGQNFSKSQMLKTVCAWIEELSRGNEALKAQLAEVERMPFLGGGIWEAAVENFRVHEQVSARK